MIKVSIVLINFNAAISLHRCLEALHVQTFRDFHVIVVDNASVDGSLERARRDFPEFIYLQMRNNVGFAAANNRAIAQSDTEYIAVLNPDAFPEPTWLEKLVKAAEMYPEAAAFGSKQMLEGCAGILDGVGDIYHASGLVWRDRHGCLAGTGDDDPKEIFSPCAAAALYRRQALIDVGGFDEDFFCYLEDVDLGFRLRLAGWRARYVPEAVVHHIGSSTSGGKHSDFTVYHGHRNLVWTFVKNMPGWLFWLLLPAHLAMNIGTVIIFSLRGQGRTILRAKRDAVTGIDLMLHKRAAIQSSRKATLRDIAAALNWNFIPRFRPTINSDDTNTRRS